MGMLVVSLSSCATCKTSYRKELSNKPELEEANISYKKAIGWAEKGDCTNSPSQAIEVYRKAESYLSDAMYKLKHLGRDESIDVSEELYYCEDLKSRIRVNIGAAEKALLP